MTSIATWQRTGDPDLDTLTDQYANRFNARNMMALEPEMMKAPGRSYAGWAARFHKSAVYSVAGEAGRLRERKIDQHIRGVQCMARAMGILRSAPPKRSALVRLITLNSAVGARQSSGKLLMLNQCLCLESSTMANPVGEPFSSFPNAITAPTSTG